MDTDNNNAPGDFDYDKEYKDIGDSRTPIIYIYEIDFIAYQKKYFHRKGVGIDIKNTVDSLEHGFCWFLMKRQKSPTFTIFKSLSQNLKINKYI